MIKAGVINKYSQVCKKKEKKKKKKKKRKKKKKTVLLLFPPPQGFPKLFINNWFPSCISMKTAGKQERRNVTTFMDLIRSNKKGLRHGRFCSFQCFKIWSDCLNFKHWPILPSASGALLIFYCEIYLELYSRVTAINKKKKKKKQSIIPRSDAVVCDIWSGCTRFGNSFIESGTDKPCWSKQKRRGRKQVRSSGAFFYHSQ